MTRSPLLTLVLLLLLPGVAAAQDGGMTAFDQACARCHTADVSAPKPAARTATKALRDEPVRGPKLSELLQQRTPEQLRTWIRSPHAVRPETRCDTRLLAEGELEMVLGYLATSSQPPPPPREEMLRQQFKQELSERRAQKQRKAQNPSRPPQGKQ